MPEEKKQKGDLPILIGNKGEGIKRIKDEHSDHNHMTEGLSDNMKGFYVELSAIFPEIRVTSGKRDASGDFSHHHEGNAIDIGKEHTDVFEYLYNTQVGLSLMNKYQVGILDETDPRNMKKTDATGPHFHIGKDSSLYKTTKDRHDQFDNIQPMQSFYSQNLNFDYSDINKTEDASFNLYGNYNPEAEIYLQSPGVTPFRLVLPNQQVAETFMGEIEKEQEKEQIKEEKTNESEYRKILEEKEKQEQAKVEQVFQTMENIRKRDTESAKKEETSEHYLQPIKQPAIAVQKSLPKLPSIFKIQ